MEKNIIDRLREHRKRNKIRNKLRILGFLPPHGCQLNTEQEKIYNQINNNDLSFWYSIRKRGGGNSNLQQRKEATPERLLYQRVRKSASKKHLEINISIDDIFIPEFCPFLYIKLSVDYVDRFNDNYYTLDRIDSSKGYVKGNIQVISKLANTMKNSATKDQLIIFSKNILKYYNI